MVGGGCSMSLTSAWMGVYCKTIWGGFSVFWEITFHLADSLEIDLALSTMRAISVNSLPSGLLKVISRDSQVEQGCCVQ